jgi:hypothetical protein
VTDLAFVDVRPVLAKVADLERELVLVGGQAVNFWVSQYEERLPELTGDAPFTSKDIVTLGAAPPPAPPPPQPPPPPALADLVVAAEDRATVAIDGRVSSNGRYHDKLPPGTHSIHVTEPGMVPFSTEVDLREGETRTIQVSLHEEKRAGPLWPWFVGGAAVVVGGVIGGYFLFRPSVTTTPPPVGTLGGVSFSSFGRGLR